MSIRTLAALVDALAEHSLLEREQLAELSSPALASLNDPRELLRELVRRGWLTAYQANQLSLGRGEDLVLGAYVLLARLGEGGMGAVFKARNRKLDRVVALKVIRRERLANPDIVRRFQREVRAAAQLSHPNIVHAYDADEVAGIHFFAMEFVEGTDLARLVKDRGPLLIELACDYVRQAALGLQHAHEKGLVHRDIKPGNLLLAPHGVVKVVDMGLARLPQLNDESEGSSTLTQEGAVMGTLDYIAPEQARDSHRVDIRGDLYSLGCTLYYLLTRRVPFPGGSAAEKLLKHQLEQPRPVDQLRPEVPPAVAEVVRKLMARRPEDRFQTPAELAAALAALLGGLSTVACELSTRSPGPFPLHTTSPTADTAPHWSSIVEPRGTGPVAPAAQAAVAGLRRRRWWTAVGGVALLTGVLVLVVLLSRSRRPADVEPAPNLVKPKSLAELLVRARDRKTDREALRREVAEFWLQHDGTPRGVQAASLLRRLPSPQDKLDAKKIPGAARFPGQPKELVAVLLRDRPRVPPKYGGLAFSGDGRLLLSFNGHDVAAYLWDGQTGKELAHFEVPRGKIDRIAISPDGRRILTGHARNPVVRLWDAQKGQFLRSLDTHASGTGVLSFCRDGRRVLSVDYITSIDADLIAHLWNLETGTEVRRFVSRIKEQPDPGALLPPGGELVLVCAPYKHSVWLWDLETGKLLRRFREDVNSTVLAPDRRFISFGGWDGRVRRREVDKGESSETTFPEKHPYRIYALAISPDGKTLATSGGLAGHDPGDGGGQVNLWSAATGKILQKWAVPSGVYALAFAPDSRHLATANGDGAVCIFRLNPPSAAP
jgi:serine/threonine-protein kinase